MNLLGLQRQLTLALSAGIWGLRWQTGSSSHFPFHFVQLLVFPAPVSFFCASATSQLSGTELGTGHSAPTREHPPLACTDLRCQRRPLTAIRSGTGAGKVWTKGFQLKLQECFSNNLFFVACSVLCQQVISILPARKSPFAFAGWSGWRGWLWFSTGGFFPSLAPGC